jgi:AcrR family transcriptional regulator
MAMRLPADQRRRQLLDVACDVFATSGFHATAMDDIATAAGVTKPVLYQHFSSKRALYSALLANDLGRLTADLEAAFSQAEDNAERLRRGFGAYLDFVDRHEDAFRLLFRHAAREPEFRELVDNLTAASVEIASRNLATQLSNGPWTDWASRRVPALTIEAVIAWLDAGQPDPGQAADRIAAAVHGVMAAAHPTANPTV